MSAKITGNDGAVLQKTNTFSVRMSVGSARLPTGRQGKAGTSAPAVRPQNNPAPDSNRGASSTLNKVSESRRFVKNIDDVLGIQNLDAHFFVNSAADRRVVQLRESESRKLVRQVPTPEFLDRVAQMRKFIGENIDKKV